MPRKTLIIFITVFIIVGAIFYGVYAYLGKPATQTPTTGTDSSGYQPFNPFGSGASTNPTTTPTTGGDTTVSTPTTTPGEQTVYKLNKLSDFAIAGAAFLEDTRPIPQVEGAKVDPKAPKFQTVPSLRYVERATGHVYERYLDSGVVGEISNSTIPDIYESLFDSKAQTIIFRYLEDDNSISSFIATLGAKTGSFLAPNIIDISLSPDKTKFFLLTKTASGVTGTIQAFGQTKKSQFFSSSFDEWLSQWATNSTIYLTTKASGSADGYVYGLNTSTGSLKKILGPVAGLTTLVNSNGSLILYSASMNGNPTLGIFNIATHTTANLGISGLPEKCTWSADNITAYCAVPDSLPSGTYPDAWYQGLASFTDHFVKINTATGGVTAIDSSSNGATVDATHLFLDDTEAKIFFTNKKDSTLWSLDLK